MILVACCLEMFLHFVRFVLKILTASKIRNGKYEFIPYFIVLGSKIPSGMCAKLRTVAASNNRGHPTRSLYHCLFAPHTYIFVLRAHPVRGESHNQRNTTGEDATTSPPFYNEPHRSHVLYVKAEFRTTFISWSQHHFVAIENPERHVRKASHRSSKQQ